MKISDLAHRSGLTAHTIRYYERIGLMPRADRDGSGHRDYGPETLIWVTFIGHMKAAGMPISEMLRYARLRQQGAGTSDQRADILRKRRALVAQRITSLQATLDVLDGKIAGYDMERTSNDNDRNTA
ncbi:MerR family transcriptional regulator [Paracoccus caeni]|uniref:MerR family transcriptional regulator n=1 Tax=Paracoccus caeni TaxID=657651 RepID=A0A934SBD4_9RHOB|nr:MerR family transcriptional regulator [Paracoccus caeni]MBK4214827.1 MerR family transcriptional regulator [Paracoccus caeni]